MGKYFNLPSATAILIAAVLPGGCQRAATAPASSHVLESDLQFITGLTNLVEFDHRVVDSSVHNNPDPRVRALALDLQARVDAFNAKVQPVATRDGILPPADMSLFEQSDMHTRVAALMATSKYDFDQEFLSDEIYGNKHVLRQAEEVIREPSGDPELHALASEAVARLRENVTRLEALQAEMKS